MFKSRLIVRVEFSPQLFLASSPMLIKIFAIDLRMFRTMCIAMIGTIITVHGKVYERCELARELRDVHEIPDNQLATWVCIARHESEFNTSAYNPGSGDHGLFQLSQLFWCSPPGYACGVSCVDLRNDDIEDDVICARRAFREHKRLTGDGFNAWVVYAYYCKDKHYADNFLDGCFHSGVVKTSSEDDDDQPLPTVDYYPHLRQKTTTTNTEREKLITKVTPLSMITSVKTKFLKTTTSTPITTPKLLTTFSITKKPSISSTSTTMKTTRKATITKEAPTTTPITRKPLVVPSSTTITLKNNNQGKVLKATVENDEFAYAITKTGYKFTRF